MTDGQSNLLTAAGILGIGGIIASWFFSRWYYDRGRAESDAATKQQRQTLNAIALKQEQPDISEFTRDADGNPSGVTRTATGHAKGSSQVKAVGMATYSPPPVYDRQNEQPEREKQDSDDD
jgi:hypothetical protein